MRRNASVRPLHCVPRCLMEPPRWGYSHTTHEPVELGCPTYVTKTRGGVSALAGRTKPPASSHACPSPSGRMAERRSGSGTALRDPSAAGLCHGGGLWINPHGMQEGVAVPVREMVDRGQLNNTGSSWRHEECRPIRDEKTFTTTYHVILGGGLLNPCISCTPVQLVGLSSRFPSSL
jgi:hypothetical protein